MRHHSGHCHTWSTDASAYEDYFVCQFSFWFDISLGFSTRSSLIEEVLLLVPLGKALPRSLHPKMLLVSTHCDYYQTTAELLRGSCACGDLDYVSAISSFSADASKSHKFFSVEANFGVFIASLPALRPLFFALSPIKSYLSTRKGTLGHRFKSIHKSAHKHSGTSRNTFERMPSDVVDKSGPIAMNNIVVDTEMAVEFGP